MSFAKSCPFCDVSQSFRHITDLPLARVIYPKEPGCKYHVLIMPKRHVQTIDELTVQEQRDVFALLNKMVRMAKAKLGQDFIGYNILSNNGSEKVNQRVPHCHIHLFLRLAQEEGNPIIAKHTSSAEDLTDEQFKDMKTIQSWFN